MFVNDADSLLNAGENLHALDSLNLATASPDPLHTLHSYSESLSSIDAATHSFDQVMASLEAAAIVIARDSVVSDRTSQTAANSVSGYEYGGHTYLLTAAEATWEEAQAEAVRLGGNLVTINNAAEDQWLTNTFGEGGAYWMGLSDRQQEGVFEWASGEAVDYTNWAAGEPDDYAGTQDYGRINYGDSLQWNDEHSYTRLRGIVEINSVVSNDETTGNGQGGALQDSGNSDSDNNSGNNSGNNEAGIVHNGSRYLLLEDNLTWEAAQKQAQQLGGNLVTVNDAAEEQWLQQTFGTDRGLWTGINDQAQEGVFTWASGEAVSYTNWAAGEPDDYAGTQDYGTLNYGDAKQWNDEHSYTELQGIVEIKLNGDVQAPEDSPTAPAPQTPNSVAYGDSEYLLLDEALTWEEAQAEAQQLGGNLVTVNDAAEEQWLKQTFSDEALWIGINDRAQEGTFTWASGEAVDYTNWAAGEPDDYAGTQDYGTLNYGEARQWNDEHSYARLKGIVEIKLNGEDAAETPPVLPEAESPTVVVPVDDSSMDDTPTPSSPVVSPPSAEEPPVYSIYDDAFTRSVPDNYSGYNANAVEISDWSNIDLVNALADAVEEIGGQTLRIPGGDTANYWDWDIGGVVQWSNEAGEARPTWEYPYFLPEPLPLALNWEYGTTASLENMHRLFTESGAEPLWVVNMNTSDLGKEMRHLQEALAAGYDIERIELGNELYFGIQNYVRPDFGGEAPQVGGTPTARDYAAQAKEWAIAIRSIPGLENATIAVTGVSPEHVPERRGVEWWPALLEKTGPDNRSAVDVVDAFTLHPYYSTNDLGITKGDVGNFNRAGEIARQGIAYLRDTLEDPALHNEELKDKELWITEHNIIEDAVVVLGGTWLQALMIDIHTQEFLKDTRVTSSYAHILTGNAQWQGITDEYGLQIDGSQRGIADRPFTTDAEDAFEPTAMGLVLGKTADVFDDGTATLLKSGEAFIAWMVENSETNISAVNANSQSDTLILPEGQTWEIVTYKADPWATVYEESELQISVQTLRGGETLTIDAFTKVIATAR